jgi:6-phosphogluconolactonase (cycloisomerase 2 family)
MSHANRRPLAAVLSIGPRLAQFDVDVDDATLQPRSELLLAENVQYAWPHASGDFLYVATSNGGPGGTRNDRHEACVVRLDPVTRALGRHGAPQPLPARPVHLSLDERSRHALVAYNDPSGLTVHRVAPDGMWGETVPQPAPLDAGIYAHQVRVAPGDRSVILVTRGNSAAHGKPEDPGALKVFAYRDGVLRPIASVAPGGGYGFGPRHVDMHPDLPWVFASLERQNALQVFALAADGTVAATPSFSVDTLADPAHVHHRQLAGAIHLHPSGRFVYVANRALGLAEIDGRTVSMGGETAIVAFAIDRATGRLRRIGHADTMGGSPRTFALDPSGRLMLVANSTPLPVHGARGTSTTPPNVAVFRVRDDGTLHYVRRYEFPDAERPMLWIGLVA